MNSVRYRGIPWKHIWRQKADFPVFDENGNENRERSRRVVISMTLNEDAFITEDVGDWDQRVDELGEMAL